MTTADVLTLNQTVLDSWNRHDTNAFLELCDENIVWRDTVNPEPFKGKEGAKIYFEMWRTAFPDFQITLLNAVANETSVACEIEFNATNSGSMTMPGQPEIPPTNIKVSAVKETVFFTMKDGKIIEISYYPDMMGLMTQLGLMLEQEA
ncbi:MAG: ester cyclase [Bacteroidia bacterium]|nr:ester cyclase [Bacteroidia bacterium]